MASTRGSSIDRTTEYTEFISRVAEYYHRRGTPFDPEPRVGNRHVDLRRLFEVVVQRGGYDAVSAEKMAWRRLGVEFGLGQAGTAPGSMAFNLKTAYYKNLAAYEITTIHGKEPPPREILEDISARGGNLLTRTLENFEPHGGRDQGHLGGIESVEGSTDGPQTAPTEGSSAGGRTARGTSCDAAPVADSEPSLHKRLWPCRRCFDVNNKLLPSASRGRLTTLVTRLGLRQAPPQRVLFHHTASSSRSPRPTAQTASSPQPAPMESMEDPVAAANGIIIDTSEPSPDRSSGRGRFTAWPASSAQPLPDESYGGPKASDGHGPYEDVLLPGTGHQGPNIYDRVIMSLRCGLHQEVEYALHHLLRMSHEKGQSLMFNHFPDLPWPLMKKYAELGEVLYGVDWSVIFEKKMSDGALDVLIAASNNAQPEPRLPYREDGDRTRGPEVTGEIVLAQIAHAGLVLRNITAGENAAFLARLWPTQQLLTAVLSMHDGPEILHELKRYALDMAEEITPHWELPRESALLRVLQQSIHSQNRARLLPALRAIGRIATDREEAYELQGMEVKTLHRVVTLLLVPHDDELVLAALIFLQQYTTAVANIQTMIDEGVVVQLISELTHMLLHGARDVWVPIRRSITSPRRGPHAQGVHRPATSVADLPIIEPPAESFEEIRPLPEPERTMQWVRACFESDDDHQIKQVDIWTAYGAQFAKYFGKSTMIQASEFMTLISEAIPSAHPRQFPGDRYVVDGIRPRDRPVDRNGRVYLRCAWQTTDHGECGVFMPSAAEMSDHVMLVHLEGTRAPDGRKWLKTGRPDKPYFCRWGGCKKFDPDGTSQIFTVAQHAKLHFSDPKPKPNSNPPGPQTGTASDDQVYLQRSDTARDERGQATGIPIAAVCVLRNLAMLMMRMDPTRGPDSLIGQYFLPSKKRLYHVWAVNSAVRKEISDLVEMVMKGSMVVPLETDEREGLLWSLLNTIRLTQGGGTTEA